MKEYYDILCNFDKNVPVSRLQILNYSRGKYSDEDKKKFLGYQLV